MIALFFLLICFCIPLISLLLTFIISKTQKSTHTKRNCIISFVLIFNLQLFYFLCWEEVETRFGIYDDNWETRRVSTVYGDFEKVDQIETLSDIDIDSVAEYDNFIIVKLSQDSSYSYIDNHANKTNVSSLSELPVAVSQKDFVSASEYINDLYWKIYNENHIDLIKILIALILSMLITTLEYIIFKNRRKIMSIIQGVHEN
ncbi:MAG: hypothetical protein U0K71_04760 [Paludibacteraceae bacterium]|nr:hypothetical protein [Paludibacteraceae bacterium]